MPRHPSDRRSRRARPSVRGAGAVLPCCCFLLPAPAPPAPPPPPPGWLLLSANPSRVHALLYLPGAVHRRARARTHKLLFAVQAAGCTVCVKSWRAFWPAFRVRTGRRLGWRLAEVARCLGMRAAQGGSRERCRYGGNRVWARWPRPCRGLQRETHGALHLHTELHRCRSGQLSSNLKVLLMVIWRLSGAPLLRGTPLRSCIAPWRAHYRSVPLKMQHRAHATASSGASGPRTPLFWRPLRAAGLAAAAAACTEPSRTTAE